MPCPRAIWACSAGTCCPPGQKGSCEAVASAPQCALEAHSRLTTRVLERHISDVPVMPCWVVIMEHSSFPIKCIPAAGTLWADSSVASSWSWHFLTTLSLAPHTLLYIYLQKCWFLLPGIFAIYMMISRKLWYSENWFGCCLKGHAYK